MNQATKKQTSMTDEIVDAIVRQAIAWRVELLLFTLPIALGAWLYVRIGLTIAIVALASLTGLVLGVRGLRRVLFELLHRSKIRRRVEAAFSSLPSILSDRRPRIRRISRTAFGDRVRVLLTPGTSIDDLVKMESVLASSLGVRQVRCQADSAKRNRVTISITSEDPFSESTPSPLLDVSRTDLWDACDLGVNEDGLIESVNVVERQVLFGGEPGSGKSVALCQLVATGALDPTCDLWIFDGKVVELSIWQNCAKAFVGYHIDEAVSTLEELVSLMEHRYEQMHQLGLRKVTRSSGLRLQVVVFDELAIYLAGPDKLNSQRCLQLLRDLVARGRAAGIVVLAATQKPSAETVPSSLRDLFGLRWALRCSTRDASDTVLGAGWASEGYSASLINASERGVGFVLYDGVPVKIRAFLLSDHDVAILAERAERLRGFRR